jgi:hypothetical protein
MGRWRASGAASRSFRIGAVSSRANSSSARPSAVAVAKQYSNNDMGRVFIGVLPFY